MNRHQPTGGPTPSAAGSHSVGLTGLDPWTRTAFGLLQRLGVGRLSVTLADGRRVDFDSGVPGPDAVLHLRDRTVVKRFLVGGHLAFAEAYMDGAVESPDIVAVIELFERNKYIFNQGNPDGLLRILTRRLLHWLNRNSRRGSSRNIAFHYDLGNAFYALWLDPSMTYSSAVFAEGVADLEAAQTAKNRRLAAKLGLRPGQRILDIGCGWGSFAIHAAQEHGVQVLGITLSREQHAYAAGWAERAGLSDRVRVEVRDFRDAVGQFDAIASIEMFEAVGEAYWPDFFRQLHDRLKPGGRAALQVITIAEEGFADYRANPDFIQRYIFPGGMLPTRRHLVDLARAHGLDIESEEAFGLDYARTLACWRSRFHAHWPAIERQGFDARFRRMWDCYLAYCEGGFRGGFIDVRQISFVRP
ncbi:SAM-dependent methyltransferase [Thalassobaculum litoreum]|uniref:Cyclopropane-fatty-acyl-phospholipid synthase n=1 Tax=Thalassobaculum litoreum DSM 18839 TaxID=1123362 RepID=A0A8G2BMP0_9PROT|nr:cyclopropane-fatty-acyl-phospholipid synthase family protein [Thalassobaculum litoreum]SDG50140.1 cyclopropane-fatty-acyl-phospholipid synthase [Thalassobaculum litoreum DSM 18839]